MGEKSSIQWTEASWNPWHGCKKISDGCKFCYMYRDKIKFGQDPFTVVKSKSKFTAPLSWKEPKVIFTCSWSDWFIDEADAWRNEAWDIVHKTPHHTYQILTKRIERAINNLPINWGEGYSNVWLGASVENHKAVYRVAELQKVPAKVRFLSVEPLLGAVDLGDLSGIHMVIVGGESGNDNGEYKYRECKIEWIEDVIKQCKEQNVHVFVKQMGTFLAKEMGLKDRNGGEIDEFPEHLRIREFPVVK